MAKHKRFDQKLRQAQKKFGDVPISGLLALLQRRGRPPELSLQKRVEIFLCVETIKACGINTTTACREAAKFFTGLTAAAVEKRYAKGREDFGGILAMYRHEILSNFQDRRPRLKKFLQKIKSPPKRG